MEPSAGVLAARAAMGRGDLAAAVTALEAHLLTDQDPAAREMLGALKFVDDDLAGARDDLERAFAQWCAAGQPRAAALVAAALADLHSSGFGNRVVGGGWIRRAQRLLEAEGRCVEMGYVGLAVIACDVEDVAELERAAADALDLAQEFHDVELEVRALADGGYAHVVQGRTAAGFAQLDEAMAMLSSGAVTNLAVACMSYCALLAACDRTGDARRAEEWTSVITSTLTDAFEDRPRAMHTHCRLVYGSVLCTVGRWPEGEAALLDAIGPYASRYHAHRADAAVRLASLRLLQGRSEDAAELLHGHEDRPSAYEPLVRLHLGAGEADVAEAVARRGLAVAGNDRLRTGALLSLLVQVALARDDAAGARTHADALLALARSCESSALRAEALLAQARVAGASLDLAEAVRLLQAAQRELPQGHPLLAGMIALELALSLREVGDHGGALDEARRAGAMFDALGARPLSDRVQGLLRALGSRGRGTGRRPTAVVATLTPREQEVLALLRQGLTNAEIGERLFITGKTAEHHVSNVLAKLGVRSRAEAAAVAAAAVSAP